MTYQCAVCHRLVRADESCPRCAESRPLPPYSMPLSSEPVGVTREAFGDDQADRADLYQGLCVDDGWVEVLAPLGEGGTADVYRAFDHRIGENVALKVLRADLATTPKALACLQAEASVLAQLKHPGFVGFHRSFWHEGRFAMVLELLDGGDLSCGLPTEGYSPTQVVRWSQQLLQALDALHARGLVHRDLKLENILLDDAGNARLADLGIRYDMRDISDLTNLRGRTGTPRTMSPEQARGEQVDQRSDIYTVGLLICELATGQLPFPHPPATGPAEGPLLAPNLDALHAVLGEDIMAVVARSLAPAPQHRFQRALAMRVALEAAVGHGTSHRRFRIGRDESQVDLVVEGDGVSGVHCELQWFDGYVMVTDLDSTNGTHVDGRRLAPHQALAVGPDAQLRLGRSVELTITQISSLLGTPNRM